MKTIPALATATLLVSSAVLADTAILVALPSEQSALSRQVRIVGQPVELAQHKISIGYHKGEKLYIVRTGAGNLNSAMVTQALLTRYRIDRVISIGVAGNLNDEWKIGDVLIASDVVSHQQGKETPAGFEVKEQPPSAVSHRVSAEYKQRCEALQSNAVEIAKGILERPQAGTPAPPDAEGLKAESRGLVATTHTGRLVSGDSFIASTAKRKWLHDTFHADTVDMVSAGIARVCEANGTPYVIIRVLSDNADESASAAFAAFVSSSKEPVTVLVALGLVERLAVLPPIPAH